MKKIMRIVAPLLVVLGGVAIAAALVKSRPVAERAAPEKPVPAVEVLVAAPGPRPALVRARGAVEAAQRVAISPEVSGRIVSHAPGLVPGGRVAKGEVIARIDPRDYRLAIELEQEKVRRAELELELEQGRVDIARREWEMLGRKKSPEEAALALRQPHLASARQSVAAARSALERARLNLERTEIRAPFNALVAEESVEVGKVVAPGTPLATLIGSDRFWVAVSVQVEDLAVLRIPGFNAPEGEGSPATIRQQLGVSDPQVRHGRILQLQAELDPATRTARLLVGIDDPLAAEAGSLPLLVGAFVEVTLEGRALEDAVELPRSALSEGDRVWVVDEAGQLARRTVRVGWRAQDSVVVTAGLPAGERVVVSPLALPIDGMRVRTPTAAVQP